MNIALSKPQFDDHELAELKQVLDSGWVMQGPKVAEFERQFAAYLGCEWAVAVSSCSTALHLAMRAIGIGKGDEVIVPSLTWIATAAAVEQCGGKAVFCDVDLDTFNIDVRSAERLINQRTKAIIAVNLFGLAANLNELKQVAKRNDIELIEDGACSLGATISGKQSGTFGRLGCFSFHPRKSITTGEGGMIVGTSGADEALLRSLRSHGVKAAQTGNSAHPYDLGEFDQLGYNYRLTDLQAAVGLAQMRKLDGIIERRRAIAKAYNSGLAGLRQMTIPTEPDGYRHAFQSYVLLIAKDECDPRASEAGFEMRNQMMIELKKSGIATRPGTQAVHSLQYFRESTGLNEWALPKAWRAMNQSIALPLYPAMTDAEVSYVIESVRSVHGRVCGSFKTGGAGSNQETAPAVRL
ncbi:MAG: DegT/DnrJ/EryC1/StrS family aminotransferase [Candidatus Zixiibacteriota bacterium]